MFDDNQVSGEEPIEWGPAQQKLYNDLQRGEQEILQAEGFGLLQAPTAKALRQQIGQLRQPLRARREASEQQQLAKAAQQMMRQSALAESVRRVHEKGQVESALSNLVVVADPMHSDNPAYLYPDGQGGLTQVNFTQGPNQNLQPTATEAEEEPLDSFPAAGAAGQTSPVGKVPVDRPITGLSGEAGNFSATPPTYPSAPPPRDTTPYEQAFWLPKDNFTMTAAQRQVDEAYKAGRGIDRRIQLQAQADSQAQQQGLPFDLALHGHEIEAVQRRAWAAVQNLPPGRLQTQEYNRVLANMLSSAEGQKKFHATTILHQKDAAAKLAEQQRKEAGPNRWEDMTIEQKTKHMERGEKGVELDLNHIDRAVAQQPESKQAAERERLVKEYQKKYGLEPTGVMSHDDVIEVATKKARTIAGVIESGKTPREIKAEEEAARPKPPPQVDAEGRPLPGLGVPRQQGETWEDFQGRIRQPAQQLGARFDDLAQIAARAKDNAGAAAAMQLRELFWHYLSIDNMPVAAKRKVYELIEQVRRHGSPIAFPVRPPRKSKVNVSPNVPLAGPGAF